MGQGSISNCCPYFNEANEKDRGQFSPHYFHKGKKCLTLSKGPGGVLQDYVAALCKVAGS